jgi:hypothetical protein
VKQLYSVSVVILAYKLAVVNAGCKIVGAVIIIIRRAATTTSGPVLAIHYWPVLHNCHPLLDIIVLTPALLFPTKIDKD